VALTPGVTNFSKEPTKPAIDVNPEQGVIAGVARLQSGKISPDF
jgi:hypothetical protein